MKSPNTHGRYLNLTLPSHLQNAKVEVQHEDSEQVHHPHGQHGQAALNALHEGGGVR